MTAVVPEMLALDVGEGLQLHGLRLRGEGRMRLIFLHPPGSDLDAVLPLVHLVGVPEVDKVAFDLPGDGLSPAVVDIDAVLSLACDRLGPLVPMLVVACGEAAVWGWRLASRPDVAGLCLLAPSGGDALDSAFLRRPGVVFLPSGDEKAADRWQHFTVRQRARWLKITLPARELDDMLRPDELCCRQVASHLCGFARELLMQSAVADLGGHRPLGPG